MKTIQQRELSFEGELGLTMPEDSEIVATDINTGRPFIYFIGDNQDDADTEERYFACVPNDMELHPQWRYIGTLTPAAMNRNKQWHVIETTDTHRAEVGGGAASWDE